MRGLRLGKSSLCLLRERYNKLEVRVDRLERGFNVLMGKMCKDMLEDTNDD